MKYSNGKFLIVGLATSGYAATKLLLSLGACCQIYDEGTSQQIQKNKEDLVRFGATLVGETIDNAIRECEVVVLSPGIPIDHKIAVTAKRMGKRICGELELGYLLLKSPIIAVTGTNGKTTVCSMLDAVLNDGGYKSFLAGNIGTPLTSVVDETDFRSIGVVEVSSFQLETVHQFCPHIAVVLNVTPDHLSRHYNINNYIYLKSRILANLRESEWAVLNADDETVVKFAEKTRAKVKLFSTKKIVDGAYLKDGYVYYNNEIVIAADLIPQMGVHNISNVLAVVVSAKLMGVPNETICEAISTFKGVRHRIEFVLEQDGIKYYNDSKSTNVDATVKAVDSLSGRTVVILGGKDKGVSFDELFAAFVKKHVSHAVLTGETRYKMLEAAERVGFLRVTVTSSFESAIKIAKLECSEGGNVLLSPAAASFDAFSNYEERGNEFVRLVKQGAITQQ